MRVASIVGLAAIGVPSNVPSNVGIADGSPMISRVEVANTVGDCCGKRVLFTWAVEVLAPGNKVQVGVTVRVGKGVRVGAGVGERYT